MYVFEKHAPDPPRLRLRLWIFVDLTFCKWITYNTIKIKSTIKVIQCCYRNQPTELWVSKTDVKPNIIYVWHYYLKKKIILKANLLGFGMFIYMCMLLQRMFILNMAQDEVHCVVILARTSGSKRRRRDTKQVSKYLLQWLELDWMPKGLTPGGRGGEQVGRYILPEVTWFSRGTRLFPTSEAVTMWWMEQLSGWTGCVK